MHNVKHIIIIIINNARVRFSDRPAVSSLAAIARFLFLYITCTQYYYGGTWAFVFRRRRKGSCRRFFFRSQYEEQSVENRNHVERYHNVIYI